MISELDRVRLILYVLAYMWNVKMGNSLVTDGGMVVIWGWEVGKTGRYWSKVETLSCKMSASWGSVCSMLTVVNLILLLHAGSLSGEYIVSVVTTHKTWEFGGDGCVGLWIVINISQCTRVT